MSSSQLGSLLICVTQHILHKRCLDYPRICCETVSSAPVGGGRNFEPSALSIASLLKGGGFDETWHLRGANDRYRRWGTVEELGKPPKVLSIADIARASANGSFVPIL